VCWGGGGAQRREKRSRNRIKRKSLAHLTNQALRMPRLSAAKDFGSEKDRPQIEGSVLVAFCLE